MTGLAAQAAGRYTEAAGSLATAADLSGAAATRAEQIEALLAAGDCTGAQEVLGKHPEAKRLTSDAGSRIRRCELEASSAEPAVPDEPAPESAAATQPSPGSDAPAEGGIGGLGIAGWTIFGAGVVTAGVSIPFWLELDTQNANISSAANQDEADTATRAASDAQTLSIALTLAGGAVAVAGLVMALLDGGGGDDGDSGAVSVGPMPLRGGGGLSVRLEGF